MPRLNKTFAVNQSLNYAELDKFNYVELIYYSVLQSFSQTVLQNDKLKVKTGLTHFSMHKFFGNLLENTSGRGMTYLGIYKNSLKNSSADSVLIDK